MNYIPLVNTLGGELVPMSTWHALNITHLAYQLEPLLIKPGIDILMSYASLADYLGWSGKIVLDLGIYGGQADNYVITSPFDGTKIRLGKEAIEELIVALKPVKLDGVSISDEPLRAASQGWFIENEVLKPINDVNYRISCEVMDAECQCPTCSINLTKAYLHHLWTQVPGLCQRFLVQHNVFQYL